MGFNRIAYVVVMTLIGLLTTVHSQSQECQTPGGGTGECMNLRECPPQLSLLQQIQAGTAPPGSLGVLRSSICDRKDNLIFVCCPRTTPSEPSPPSPSEPRNLLPPRCGVRGLVDRIISGEDAPLLAWPWMALLESVGANGLRSFVCGGVLISERYVLTAAHCVDEATGFTLENVRLGEHTITQNPDCQRGVCSPPFQSVGVDNVLIHEEYGSPFGCRNCNDIALIRLNRSVQFRDLHVQPVCLPLDLQNDLGFSQSEFSNNNRRGWVAGWGTLESTTFRRADVLQQVQLPINNTLCKLDLGVFPDPNMALCAGGNGQDTCRGDSGGPMVMGNIQETRYYAVGIVSRGPRICGAANTGGLYTNINFYVPWILQNLRP